MITRRLPPSEQAGGWLGRWSGCQHIPLDTEEDAKPKDAKADDVEEQLAMKLLSPGVQDVDVVLTGPAPGTATFSVALPCVPGMKTTGAAMGVLPLAKGLLFHGWR